MPDILFILLLTLVIFGPRKLPELARQLGKYQGHFSRMKRELTDEIEAEMRQIRSAEEADPTGSSLPRPQLTSSKQ